MVYRGTLKKKVMTFFEVETITTRLPSWTGGVDPDRAKRRSGDGVVELTRAKIHISRFS